jgi:DNA-binding MarR family transcriptional regulator
VKAAVVDTHSTGNHNYYRSEDIKMVFEDNKIRNRHMQARQLLGKARRMMLYARNKELAPYHISSNQAFLLFVIYYHSQKHPDHRITLAELSQQTDREKNTISLQMTTMEKDGLVKKIREVPKSNQLSFELTAKGLDAFHKSKHWKTDKAIMSALSKEELEILVGLLTKIIKKAQKYQ